MLQNELTVQELLQHEQGHWQQLQQLHEQRLLQQQQQGCFSMS